MTISFSGCGEHETKWQRSCDECWTTLQENADSLLNVTADEFNASTTGSGEAGDTPAIAFKDEVIVRLLPNGDGVWFKEGVSLAYNGEVVFKLTADDF